MLIRRIQGCTDVIGADQGYRALPIRVEPIAMDVNGQLWHTQRILTAWEPTPKELERINAGESIVVSLIGANPYPPIQLLVEPSESVSGKSKHHAVHEDMIDSIDRLITYYTEMLVTDPLQTNVVQYRIEILMGFRTRMEEELNH